MQPLARRDAPGFDWGSALPHLEALTNCLECGALVADGEGRIVLCSPSLAATFGLTVEGALQMTADELVTHVTTLVPNPPPVIRDKRLLATEGRVVCEEFEIRYPSRSVVRWVARVLTTPSPAQVVICTDITTEVDLASAYERLAVTDLLTGLANRRGAEQQIRREMSRAKRYGADVCFVLFDVDHFKRVNDRHGHNVGDDVLRIVATTVAGALRESDLAARWGGEEFLAMLPNTGLDGARLCAERVRVAVARKQIPVVGAVTISGGVAQLEPSEDLAQVLARADKSLYRSKAEGRNRIL